MHKGGSRKSIAKKGLQGLADSPTHSPSAFSPQAKIADSLLAELNIERVWTIIPTYVIAFDLENHQMMLPEISGRTTDQKFTGTTFWWVINLFQHKHFRYPACLHERVQRILSGAQLLV